MSLFECLLILPLIAAPFTADVDSVAKESLAKLPGKTAFVFTEITETGSKPLYGLRSDERFAIGSSFKLYILGRLIDEVNTGRRQAEDTMRLTAGLKGPPASEMAGWPIGSPVTLHTLALKMISISDNTATDHLHYLLGREQIERMLPLMGHAEPSLNRPLLSTSEMVRLRDRKNDMPAIAFRKLDEPARRRFLVERFSGAPDFESVEFDASAYDLAEWYASPVEMSKALAWIHEHTQAELPAAPLRLVLTVDPKLDYDPKVWTFVGFKGGSEDQILAGNWLLQHQNGRWYTFHLFWNSPKEPAKGEALLEAIKPILKSVESKLEAH